MSEAVRVQVLVVGSGAGGATTAQTLAAAGYDVLVLEDGARNPVSGYGQSAPDAMRRLYRRRGMTPISGRVPMGFVEGRGLGGSTEINSGFWHRLRPDVALGWNANYDLAECDPEDLNEHFAWTEKQLGVGTFAGKWPASTEVFARGIERMGWSYQEVPRAAPGCEQNNTCAYGCPNRAKQGMTQNLIPAAEAAGARFLTGCRVKSLIKKRGRVTGVLAEITGEDGNRGLARIEAEHVFVCAGPTQTPVLLRSSGIKYHVGDTLRLHPMLKVVAKFPERLDAHRSVLPLLQVKEFWPEISLGGSFLTPGHLAMGLNENAPDIGDQMANFRQMASFYVGIKGSGRGSVRPSRFGRGSASIRYGVSREDLRHLSVGLARLSMVLLAAGAETVYPSVHGLPEIRTRVEAARWLDELLPASSVALTTVHAFSSCPIGERTDRCAANSFGKVHRYDNLYLNDASMLPSSPGVNPQGTVMALARRNALHFAATQP
jgi:choline dehydrogenase-like flavoprotein